jgi:hypothetical protein
MTRVLWSAELTDGRSPNGSFVIRPRLDDCESTAFFVAYHARLFRLNSGQAHFFRPAGLMRPPAKDTLTEAGGTDARCAVLLAAHADKGSSPLVFEASTFRSLGQEVGTIQPPRRTRWLALLPLSVIADTTLFPVMLCAATPELCRTLVKDLLEDLPGYGG